MIDVRGPRFSAALTAMVLAVALLTGATWLLAWQVAVFAVAAVAGLRYSPYGMAFHLLKRWLDLGHPPVVEPEAGPRFSQAAGLGVAGSGLAAIVAGAPVLGWALVVVVTALATLLAVTGLCVGCRIYGLLERLRLSQ